MVPISGPSGAGLFAICCTRCLISKSGLVHRVLQVLGAKPLGTSHPWQALTPLCSGCQDYLKAGGHFSA